jgi:ACS family pantothenate transporter-like MFS transporter
MGQPQDISTNVDHAAVVIHSDEELKQKPRKWYYYLWDTLDKPKEERWFMFKLDAALLTFASLGMISRIGTEAVLIQGRIFYQVFGSDEHQ